MGERDDHPEGVVEFHSRAAVEPPQMEGVDAGEWNSLIQRGRQQGSIHAEQVTHVLRHVELTGDVLDVVTHTLSEAGITLDETVDESDEPDDTPSAAQRLAQRDLDEADEHLLSRRRRRRVRRAAPRTEGLTSDGVRMYLREIGQVDLLTGDDERRLAQLIEEGHLAAQQIDEAAEQPGPLDDVEMRRLMRAVQRGERAKSELTQANLRLVVSIAKRYSGRGMQLLDLIQEGNLGLMRAVDKFDHSKGFKFSTYATWWIRQAITRSIADQARTIRIPVHMVEHMNRVIRAKRQLHQELEREPTIDELAARVQLEPDRVRELLRISLDPLSLDSPIGEEDESNLGDFIEDSSTDGPADAATRVMLTQAVGAVLNELSEREQEIVRLRFGLDGGQAKTLEEVGTRVRRDPRADPPDRGQDPRQAPPPPAQPAPAGVPRSRVGGRPLAATPLGQDGRMGYGGKWRERERARELRAQGPGRSRTSPQNSASRRHRCRSGSGTWSSSPTPGAGRGRPDRAASDSASWPRSTAAIARGRDDRSDEPREFLLAGVALYAGEGEQDRRARQVRQHRPRFDRVLHDMACGLLRGR